MSYQSIAVVSGGNRGIGLAICRGLAREGLQVVLCSRDTDAGRKAAEQLAGERGSVHARQLDVNEQASVDALAAWLQSEFGQVDVLVNNAAILIDRVQSVLELESDVLLSMFQTNVAGPLRLTKALVPLLRKGRDARIVNISSVLGQLAYPGTDRPGYRLSKLALNSLTRMLAAELEPDGIKVNAVTPGWVRTRMGGKEAPRTPEQGADGAVWLALARDVPSGGFYMDRKLIPW